MDVRAGKMRREIAAMLLALVLVLPTLLSAGSSKRPDAAQQVPLITMDGGRRLEFVRAFSSEQEVNPSRPTWKRVMDFIAGPPEYRRMVRPFDVATDSQGRIIVTDPGARAVHVFDFERKKYTRLAGGKGEEFLSPLGVAVDASDNIYVSDSRSGKILVFDARGKFQHFVGSVAKNEGFFKRATGLAIDRQLGELYVTDTLRDEVFVLSLEGKQLRHFGGRGTGPGEFNYPTGVLLRGSEVLVVDAMNFRVQVLDREGHFLRQFGIRGTGPGMLFRPKGIAADSEGSIYLVDAEQEDVQVFGPDGGLRYFFGHTGTGPGEFELPAGVSIDAQDRVLLVDSYNRRVQVFQYVSEKRAAGGQH